MGEGEHMGPGHAARTALVRRLKGFLESPYVNLSIGFVLLLTSLSEAWSTLGEDLSNFRLGAHHGLGLFGIFFVLKSLVEVAERVVAASEAAEDVEEGTDEAEAG